MKEKLLDGSKTQTIRKPRKYPIKLGDRLFIYWKLRTKECEKLGEGKVTKIMRKAFCQINEKDAVLDGFHGLGELIVGFREMHKPTHDTFFDIITWEWTKKDV